MLYWIIPYLVAYNASNSGEFKYGPEHVFKAEVYNNVTLPTESAHAFSAVFMNFACRPMNSSLIQCHVNSATVDKWDVAIGSNTRIRSTHDEEFGLDDIVFQIQFNEDGISRVWFLNSDRSISLNMIRAIIGTLSTGISLVGKKFENYVSQEKTINGICDTTFNIRKMHSSDEKVKDETVIEGYKFDVPSLGARSDDEMIVIEKNRNPNQCVKKTPYLFGSTEEEDAKAGYTADKRITNSLSRIYLGRKSFSTYTEVIGTVTDDDSPTKPAKLGEMIRVSLQAIRPAKEELQNTKNVVKVGAGFQPGTPWPERGTEKKIKYFM